MVTVLRAVTDAQVRGDRYHQTLSQHYAPGGALEHQVQPRARLAVVEVTLSNGVKLVVHVDRGHTEVVQP